MKHYYKSALCLCILTLSNWSVEAQKTVKGRVVDGETGATLPRASIRSVRGRGMATALDGSYHLPYIKGDTLIVSYVGFETQRVPTSRLVKDGTIRLMPTGGLQEVLVTASIASARSSRAIGSKVDKVDASKLMTTISPSNISELLDGRVSGVQMFASNGKVGMPIRFNMRSGATMSMDRDPIIYVDGVRYGSSNTSDINSSQDALSALNDLAMEDIATIDVVKGPSAASSYGAEAANGVVVITTKRGSRSSDKMRVSVKYTHGVNQLGRKYDQFVNNDAINNFFRSGQISKLYASLDKSFGRAGKVYLSINQNDVEGIVPGNRDKRTNLRATYDLRQGPLSLDVTAGYTRGDISIPQTAQGRYDAIWNLIRTQEPWGYVSEETWRAQSWGYTNDRTIGSARLGYLLPLGIKAEALVGFDVNNIHGTYLLPFGYLLGQNDQGAKSVSDRRNSNFNMDFKLSKKFDLGKGWSLTGTLLSQLVRRYEEQNKIETSRFAADVTNISAAGERKVSETSFEQRTFGLYAEAFASYRNVLFINAGLRRDASNLIGANVASIYYPSLSVSYNIRDLKLRIAYGESGRLPYPTDAYTSYVLDGTSAYGSIVRPQYQGNPDIKPERMREIELGGDWAHRSHKLGLTAYGQFTSDAIIYEPLLSSDGWVGSRPRNLGRIHGYGAELSYSGQVWETKDRANALELFATVNWQKNEVKDTGGGDIVNYPNVIREGLPVYAFYWNRVEGPAYDASGAYNAKVGGKEEAEKSYLGKPFPDVNGSFGFNLRFARHFTLGAKLSYALGASVYNQGFYNVAGLGDNLKKRQEQLKALSKATIGTDEYKAISNDLAHSARLRANYISPADFLRLSSLSLSFDATALASKLSGGYVKGAQLTLSGQNLWLWTNYYGIEPQIEGSGGERQTRGMGSLSRDIYNTPTARSLTATVSFQF